MNASLPIYTTGGLNELGEDLGRLRLCDPAAQQRMERSLLDHGQLLPLIVRSRARGHEVLDDFLRAARSLQWSELQVAIVRAGEAQAKAGLLAEQVRGAEHVSARIVLPSALAAKGVDLSGPAEPLGMPFVAPLPVFGVEDPVGEVAEDAPGARGRARTLTRVLGEKDVPSLALARELRRLRELGVQT